MHGSCAELRCKNPRNMIRHITRVMPNYTVMSTNRNSAQISDLAQNLLGAIVSQSISRSPVMAGDRLTLPASPEIAAAIERLKSDAKLYPRTRHHLKTGLSTMAATKALCQLGAMAVLLHRQAIAPALSHNGEVQP